MRPQSCCRDHVVLPGNRAHNTPSAARLPRRKAAASGFAAARLGVRENPKETSSLCVFMALLLSDNPPARKLRYNGRRSESCGSARGKRQRATRCIRLERTRGLGGGGIVVRENEDQVLVESCPAASGYCGTEAARDWGRLRPTSERERVREGGRGGVPLVKTTTLSIAASRPPIARC